MPRRSTRSTTRSPTTWRRPTTPRRSRTRCWPRRWRSPSGSGSRRSSCAASSTSPRSGRPTASSCWRRCTSRTRYATRPRRSTTCRSRPRSPRRISTRPSSWSSRSPRSGTRRTTGTPTRTGSRSSSTPRRTTARSCGKRLPRSPLRRSSTCSPRSRPRSTRRRDIGLATPTGRRSSGLARRTLRRSRPRRSFTTSRRSWTSPAARRCPPRTWPRRSRRPGRARAGRRRRPPDTSGPPTGQAVVMHFVGVDLAWGDRKPTGLAVLDDEGHLVHVSPATTDDSIVEALAPYVDGHCLVAIDAPLIVVNAQGNRPAEAALNKDFAKYDAGAHPSNTGKREFRDQPRGARIAARLGLDMNPRSGRSRRAIEVYPHPATVALFRLERILRYKQKPGRDVEALRAELMRLLGFIEGLVAGDPALLVDGRPSENGPSPWQALRVAVETAKRKSELRVV